MSRSIPMQKAYRHIRAVVGRIIFIGLGIQIILGILWMFCNFGNLQKFGESLFYIEVSKSFLCDEYTGALYPVLLMLVRGIEGLLHIPYTYVIHLLQVSAAGYAGWRFLGAVGVRKRGYRVFGSLAILTVPMAMQCHLAVLPNSLTLSAILMEFAFVAEAVGEDGPLQGKQLVKANACWLVSALLMPDYLYLGAVPVVLLWIYDAWKYRKQKGRGVFWHLLLIAAFAGMIAGTNALIQEPGCYGRPEKTVDAALFRRFNWGDLQGDWEDWPEDMKESCSFEFTREVSNYAENMEGMLQPQLEASVGVERAQEIYRELNKRAVNNNLKEILHQITWDAVGYTLPSAALRLFFEGRGYESFAGRNYEIMKEKMPLLTRYYVDYSGWWLVAGIVLTAIVELILLLQKNKKRPAMGVICIVSAGVLILWYIMQGAGVWDYKNGLLVGALWSVWMVHRAVKCTDEE